MRSAGWAFGFVDDLKSGQQYDLIHAENGYHPISDYRRALSFTRIYVMTGRSFAQLFEVMLQGPGMSKKDGQQLQALTLKPNPEDLPLLKERLETGKVIPVIDKRYSLNAVPDALRYFGEGHARGKVAITCGTE